jgi:hypothetical protein
VRGAVFGLEELLQIAAPTLQHQALHSHSRPQERGSGRRRDGIPRDIQEEDSLFVEELGGGKQPVHEVVITLKSSISSSDQFKDTLLFFNQSRSGTESSAMSTGSLRAN